MPPDEMSPRVATRVNVSSPSSGRGPLSMVCGVCNTPSANESFTAREMMFGYRDTFEYFECSACGCIQLIEPPRDLSRYYPGGYYSLADRGGNDRAPKLRAFLKQERAKHQLFGKSLIGKWLSALHTPSADYRLLKQADVRFESSILDVGSGNGWYLSKLAEEGFRNLTGVDPFIPEDLVYGNGVKLYKKELSDVTEQFDFVMLNHSFEHMHDPPTVVSELYRITKPDSFVLIRTPVAGAFAWRTYGVNWVGLDAPRHLFIHTPASIRHLAEQVGFRLTHVEYDSTEFQFLASEQYARDIALHDERSYLKGLERSIFTGADVSRCKSRAAELNRDRDGDSACFFLRKD